MASLITPRMRFLHVPRTGGSWATHAMFAAGVIAQRPDDVPFHAGFADSRRYADRFTFAFVRHPLERESRVVRWSRPLRVRWHRARRAAVRL
jgi:hypothetical protein